MNYGRIFKNLEDEIYEKEGYKNSFLESNKSFAQHRKNREPLAKKAGKLLESILFLRQTMKESYQV